MNFNLIVYDTEIFQSVKNLLFGLIPLKFEKKKFIKKEISVGPSAPTKPYLPPLLATMMQIR